MKNSIKTDFESTRSQPVLPALSPKSQPSIDNLDKNQKLLIHHRDIKHSPRLLPVCPLKLKLPEACLNFQFKIEGSSKSLWDPNIVFLPPIKSPNNIKSVPLLEKSVKKVCFAAKSMISKQLQVNSSKNLPHIASFEKVALSLRIPNANQSARISNEMVKKKRQIFNRTSENEYSFGN
ncbi:unnamed protein product [Blepharisma stoltei]|uniref:Uncharacterized protein n=1 Tax=Blepharisma stoltei TaxID=1481888 RepID=A0AAU9JZU8_9CILI|nr:unnamed protein product [Blepharisma stoltei]